MRDERCHESRSWYISAPGADEFEAIRALAVRRFTFPTGWSADPKNTRHYNPAFLGGLQVAVLKAKSILAGYIFLLRTSMGDFYIKELATSGAFPGAGARLLLHAADMGVADGCSARLTANVRSCDAVSVAAKGWRSPIPFYERFAFRRTDEMGYSSCGPRDPRDLWLTADAAACGERVHRYLDELEAC